VSARVKICGVTSAADAAVAVEAGADLVGMILWAPSPRAARLEEARRVREVVPPGIELVGVFVDEEAGRIDELCELIGLDRVQLHGSEPAAFVRRFGERAIRGVRDGDLDDVPPGVPVVYDRRFGETPTPGELEAHWAAARAAAQERRVLLAGALHAENVAQAIAAAKPFGVDVARGVESAPGIKDHDLVRRFVAAAKGAE
jgi:phosphoribosylanthranilate isomerase